MVLSHPPHRSPALIARSVNGYSLITQHGCRCKCCIFLALKLLGAFKPKRPDLSSTSVSMLGTDVFSLVSGIVGLVAIAVSLWHWLSPQRRLRALDITMGQALRTLALIQEEHAILDRMIILRAHEQLYRYAKPPLPVLDNCVDASRTSARHQTACFRSQLLSIDSLYGTALATFSPLPWEITKVHRQVQSVLDELKVSDVHGSVFYISI
jgi:hypothetical protein